MTDLLSLYEDQHAALGRLVNDRRRTRRPRAGVAQQDARYLPPVRVIAMTDRVYDPLTPEELPVFRYDREQIVWTVEQVGSTLAGYIALTINGTRFLLECRRESLTDLERTMPGVRATVFPGLWEFDFGRNSGQVTVEAENITADENLSLCALFDDEDSVIFSGSLIVRQEAWCSVHDPGQPAAPFVTHRTVTDGIPYGLGTVARGAIGMAGWHWDAGFVVQAWQCRTFSHASGYSQEADPAI